jgi:radical SAM/Cys-rich protein
LELNLVYNPLGAYLPALQEELEADYRRALRERRGVEFSHLLTITNNPIGRFGEMLQAEGTLDDYRQLLSDAFNPATLAGMMCRDQLSVDCDGSLYDCDFNLALGLGIQAKETTTIFDVLSTGLPAGRPIMFADHCYACTAGAGSSCGGSTA